MMGVAAADSVRVSDWAVWKLDKEIIMILWKI